jgi:hypothetical protein
VVDFIEQWHDGQTSSYQTSAILSHSVATQRGDEAHQRQRNQQLRSGKWLIKTIQQTGRYRIISRQMMKLRGGFRLTEVVDDAFTPAKTSDVGYDMALSLLQCLREKTVLHSTEAL